MLCNVVALERMMSIKPMDVHSPLLKEIIKACHCFMKNKQPSILESIRKMVESVKVLDVLTKRECVCVKNSSQSKYVNYHEIYDDLHVSIGVFIIHKGRRIPLHDHPKINGFIKLLYGSCMLKSFDIVSKNKKEIVAKCTLNQKVTANDYCCFLTPEHNNLHDLEANEECCAFFDVLVPPYYTDNNPCNYYDVIGYDSNYCGLPELDVGKEYKLIKRRYPPVNYQCEDI